MANPVLDFLRAVDAVARHDTCDCRRYDVYVTVGMGGTGVEAWGRTYVIKEELKRLGFRFDWDAKKWYYTPLGGKAWERLADAFNKATSVVEAAREKSLSVAYVWVEGAYKPCDLEELARFFDARTWELSELCSDVTERMVLEAGVYDPTVIVQRCIRKLKRRMKRLSGGEAEKAREELARLEATLDIIEDTVKGVSDTSTGLRS